MTLCASITVPVRVSERLLWGLIAIRLYFGAIPFRQSAALRLQAWGFLQPPRQSWMHSMHMHAWFGLCVLFLDCPQALLADLIRSATILVLCLFRRQCALTVVFGHRLAYGWYHAGRLAHVDKC
jgi:hypothetical protein